MRNWILSTTGRNMPFRVTGLQSLAMVGIRSWTLGMFWVMLVMAVSLAPSLIVQAQEVGTIEGQVTNGTADGPEVGANVPVLLHVFRGDTEEDTLETATDAAGQFLFEGLDTSPDLEYLPEVVYLGVPYTTAKTLRFEGDQPSLVTAVTVYETTNDDSTVRLDSVHIIAESFGEVLRVSEIHLFGNTGDRTYVGDASDQDQNTTVIISLPDEAIALAFGGESEAARFVEVPGGLQDTEPVPPGTESSLAFFSYHLMVSGESVPLERRFAYPVTFLNMLVAQPGLTLKSDQLQSRGSQLFEGRQYEFHSTQSLDPDTPILFEFVPVAEAESSTSPEGMPASSGQETTATSARGSQGTLLWIGFGLAALAVVGVVVYATAGTPLTGARTSAPDPASKPQVRRLVAELADLEEAFEVGLVDEETYERQRAEKVQELKAL
ncbi:MAG TPA: hypothetical protein VLY63_04915 [Anaerolineae bacterium]|nr:hypothetical protein [Anaerolineae bacterium]